MAVGRFRGSRVRHCSIKSTPRSDSCPGSGSGGCWVAIPMWNMIAHSLSRLDHGLRLSVSVFELSHNPPCSDFQYYTSQGPNIRRSQTALASLDNLRSQIHWRSGQRIHHRRTSVGVVPPANGSSFGHGPVHFGDDLGGTKVDILEDRVGAKENIWCE